MKYLLLVAIGITVFLTCCKKDKDVNPAGSELIFRICPVDTAAILEASPLGNINPPGHTFPSNHIGFYLQGDELIPVLCMAKGEIRSIYYNEWSDDYRIEFEYTNQYLFYLDHICNVFAQIEDGAILQAGDTIGYARTYLGAFDIGVVNYGTENNFISPERYHEFYLYYEDPYKYFTDSIREILEMKNLRVGEPKGGKVNFDVDGTLAGNWFLDGTPLTWEASSYIYGANQLAFIYDMYNASTIMISCGGTLQAAPFAYHVIGNASDPTTITTSSGIVKYALNAYTYDCTMLVEMLEDRKVRVEVFENLKPEDASGFTSNAGIYVR